MQNKNLLGKIVGVGVARSTLTVTKRSTVLGNQIKFLITDKKKLRFAKTTRNIPNGRKKVKRFA